MANEKDVGMEDYEAAKEQDPAAIQKKAAEIQQEKVSEAVNTVTNPEIKEGARIFPDLKKSMEYIKRALVSKVLKGEAVWQQDATKVVDMRLPVNPTNMSKSGKPLFYTSGNAYLLMQKQFELGTKDNRWMPAFVAKNMKGVSVKTDAKGERAKATCIIVYSSGKDGGKGEYMPQYVYNYSQLNGVPEQVPSFDAERESLGLKMLENQPFGPSGKGIGNFKSDIMVFQFYEKAKKAYKEVELSNMPSQKSSISKQAEEKVKSEQRKEYEQSCEATKDAYATRLAAIQGSSPTYSGEIPEKLFVSDMHRYMQEHPERKGYALEAAKNALLRGTDAGKVEGMISALAPEAVRHGKGEYAKWAMETIGKNKAFQSALANAASERAAEPQLAR